jgi:hypothetical protein
MANPVYSFTFTFKSFSRRSYPERLTNIHMLVIGCGTNSITKPQMAVVLHNAIELSCAKIIAHNTLPYFLRGNEDRLVAVASCLQQANPVPGELPTPVGFCSNPSHN